MNHAGISKSQAKMMTYTPRLQATSREAQGNQDAAKGVLRTLNQARVVSGQGVRALNGRAPAAAAPVAKVLGAYGGSFGALPAAVLNGFDVFDSSKPVSKRGVALASAAGNAAHGVHGAFQLADVHLRTKFVPAAHVPVPPGSVAAAVRAVGKAAPILSGIAQSAAAYADIHQNGVNTSNGIDAASGAAKIVGGGLVATGIGAPIGAALIAGSTAIDIGKAAYQSNFLGTRDAVNGGFRALENTARVVGEGLSRPTPFGFNPALLQLP